MKKTILYTALLFASHTVWAQSSIKPSENLVVENIPEISSSYVNEVKNYTESRAASLLSIHPTKKEMLISTRFGNSNQVHEVKMPGGDRKQITFFEEPVASANYEPKQGRYFIYSKDIGGNEFSQLYRFDVLSKKSTLLTDGKRSQNGNITWAKNSRLIAYSSTKRNGKDRDFYMMDPEKPSSDYLICENDGGGWSISAWSEDDKKLLIGQGISINESKIYLYDLNTKEKKKILPIKEERSTFSAIGFSKGNAGFYYISNKDFEFNRLAFYNLTTQKSTYITTDIPWDITSVEMNKSKTQMIFVTNENGFSRVYLLNLETNKYSALENIPVGIIGGVEWFNDEKSIAFSMGNYQSTSDVYEYVLSEKKLIRWTESETGGLDLTALQSPELITWKSFDGTMISGYLYRASNKFTGKRPVMISIHGGPEGQSRPNFIARNNYFLNELGVSIIYPNVRGSSGYGKTFLDMDNGFKREESVKDIGALLDWIVKEPNLDAERVMVIGGSYGGYMSLAVSYHYADRIRCSIDIVGISNFNTFMKNTESYRRDLRRVEYGDEQDPKMVAYFEKIAPLNHTDKIKKPMFIIQGGNDPRVPLSEAEQMRDKIKQNGGTVWYLMAKDEGHGFKKKNNIDFQFYSTIEFMKRYLLN